MLLKHQEVERFEAGIKTEFWAGRLSSTLSFFHILIQYSHPPILVAKTGIEGCDRRSPFAWYRVRYVGKLSDNWSVIANYAWIETKITKDSPSVNGNQTALGNQLPNAPKQSANVRLKYDLFAWP